MKKLNKAAAFALAAVMALSVTACSNNTNSGGKSTVNTGDKKKIGIIQMMDHVALNGAREGFIAALAENGYKDGENIVIDYKDGNGDNNNMSTIADQFVADKKDLILAVATPAAQAVAAKTQEIPILATAVTDFVEAGLVTSNEAPGGNLSGTSDMNPVAQQLDLLFELFPDVKTIGFLYNSSEDNSRIQVDVAKKYLDEKNIKYVERTVSNQNEVQQAAQSIVTECDAIYLPTDNVFASTMPSLYDVATTAKIPVICGENGMVESGGLASLGLTYYDLGYQAGLMAVDILQGKAKVGEMPVKGAANFEYKFNADFAKAIGLEIPEKYKEFVFTPQT